MHRLVTVVRIAVLYEHPTWSRELLTRMGRRGLAVTEINVADGPARTAANLDRPHDLWVNRINVMPSPGRATTAAATALQLLLQLEVSGQPVLNGWRTHAIGGSKAAQYHLFRRLGLPTPATVAVGGGGSASTAAVVEAADQLGFPILTKPNLGGSGAGIDRFDHRDQLTRALTDGAVDFGPDGTGVLQKVITSADGFVHRVEILDDEFFYATRQATRDGVYNYCAADGCSVQPDLIRPQAIQPQADVGDRSGPPAIEIADPDHAVVEDVRRIVTAAGAWVGGVEYLLDVETGRPCYYDFNPYSNFVEGRNHELGFDPIDRFIDALVTAAE